MRQSIDQDPMHCRCRSVFTRRSILLGGCILPLLSGCSLFRNSVDDESFSYDVKLQDILETGRGLEVDAAAGSHIITLPEPVSYLDWKLPGRTQTHEGYNASLYSTRLKNNISFGAGVSEPDWFAFIGLGSNGRGVIEASPVVADGTVYVMDAKGIVSALRIATNQRIWQVNPLEKASLSRNLGGGIAVDKDTVYVTTGVANVLALDALKGTLRWQTNITTPARSAPTIANGYLYLVTLDDRLVALDCRDGKQIWSYLSTVSSTALFGQPSPAVANNMVVAGFSSGDVVAVRENSGEPVWSDTLGVASGQNSILDFPSIHGMPVISGGIAYMISIASVLLAVDIRSGRRLWEREIAGQNTPLVVGEWLYVLTTGQEIVCIHRHSGDLLWVADLRQYEKNNENKGKRPIVWTGPIMANGSLICFSNSRKYGMAKVDALTGKLIDTLPIPASVTVPPIIAGDNLYVVTETGRLLIYG